MTGHIHHQDPNMMKIAEFTQQFVLNNQVLRQLMALLEQEMNRGLDPKTHPLSTVKMFPTFVRAAPSGHERGQYIALDLGGTNFRILLITLKGKKEEQRGRIYPISETIMKGTGEQLFDHIALCVHQFLLEFKKEIMMCGVTAKSNQSLPNVFIPLGLTFSFPCIQEDLDKAVLVRWTKGFSCSGVVGKDVAALLRKALEKRNLPVNLTAVINDTTGTLMSCAFNHPDCTVGVIVGTGTNACFMERLDRVKTWPEPVDNGPPEVIINCEWGAFGEKGLLDGIRTQFDEELDRLSINPGKQVFEKMCSGMYLGELVRLIMLEATNRKALFGGRGTNLLRKSNSINAKFLSLVEEDLPGDYTNSAKAMAMLGINFASEEDFKRTKFICERVSRRSADLVAAAIAAIVNRMELPKTTVGVDGSVYKKHPHFARLLDEKMKELVNPALKFKLMQSEDGSGKGAAVVAAVASKKLGKLHCSRPQ